MTVSMSAVVVAEAVLLDGGECQVLSKYGHVYYSSCTSSIAIRYKILQRSQKL